MANLGGVVETPEELVEGGDEAQDGQLARHGGVVHDVGVQDGDVVEFLDVGDAKMRF